MTRRRTATVCDPLQPSFFDPPKVPIDGFGLAVRETLADILASAKERGLDRFAVAAEMSRLMPEQRDVSKRMLDQYCAPGSTDWRLPVEAVPALYRVTGDPRLISLITEACDHKAVPGEAAALGEMMIIEMQEQKLRERKRRWRAACRRARWSGRPGKRRGGHADDRGALHGARARGERPSGPSLDGARRAVAGGARGLALPAPVRPRRRPRISRLHSP